MNQNESAPMSQPVKLNSYHHHHHHIYLSVCGETN